MHINPGAVDRLGNISAKEKHVNEKNKIKTLADNTHRDFECSVTFCSSKAIWKLLSDNQWNQSTELSMFWLYVVLVYHY